MIESQPLGTEGIGYAVSADRVREFFATMLEPEKKYGFRLGLTVDTFGPATVTESGQVSLPGLESMLSPAEPLKGPSDTRAWGVKAHVERLPDDPKPDPEAIFDWIGIYEMERARMEALRNSDGG